MQPVDWLARRGDRLSGLLDRRIPVALFRIAFAGLLYVIVSSVVLDRFVMVWGFRADAGPSLSLASMMEGTADKPFAYRVLAPFLVKRVAAAVPLGESGELILDWLPSPVRKRFAWMQDRPERMRAMYGWGELGDHQYLAAYGLLFCCLLGVLLCWRSLLIATSSPAALAADTLPALGLLFLPLTFLNGGYIYDFPEILLASLCLLFLWKGHWVRYYACFVLGILNKETGILLFLWPLVLIGTEKMPGRSGWRHVAAHAVVGLAVLLSVRWVFHDNPGDALWYYLPKNLAFHLKIKSYLQTVDPYAPMIPVPRGLNIINVFLFVFLVFYGWQEKRSELKLLATATVLALLPLFLVWGFRDEIRVFAPSFPILFLLACDTLLRFGGHVPRAPHCA